LDAAATSTGHRPHHPQVTFNIDANGLLTVTALDLATKKSQSVTITNSKGRSGCRAFDFIFLFRFKSLFLLFSTLI
jgi:molecular chaperone DnaK (HSP70)